MTKEGTSGAQPPETNERPKIGKPKEAAAGLSSITSTFKHMMRHGHPLPGAVGILSYVNQSDGFDCPGCAWPDPDDRAIMTEFCENGAKAVAWETTLSKAGPVFFARHSIDDMKARTDLWLGDQGRLTQPMVLRKGSTHYEPLSWTEAFDLVAEQLRALESPNEAVFYTSGRTSNEAAFLYQLFVRAFGTNNLPDCSNMCHESSGVGLGGQEAWPAGLRPRAWGCSRWRPAPRRPWVSVPGLPRCRPSEGQRLRSRGARPALRWPGGRPGRACCP